MHDEAENGRRQTAALRSARRAARALDDDALLDAMATGNPWAWLEFDERYRPLLERYAVHAEISVSDWPVCISEVMADTGTQLSLPGAERPRHLRAYLVRCVRNRYLRLKRAAAVRERFYGELAGSNDGERVVRTLSSEYALRASAGSLAPPHDDPYTIAAARLIDALTRDLSTDDLALLGWAAECVPHRTIAGWTGATYEATTKRIWRLCQRLRKRAQAIVAAWPDDAEREAVRRMVGVVGERAPVDKRLTETTATRRGGAER